MPFAVLEFNDQALLIKTRGGSAYSEPGFARLTADGIETGETARATAWKEPQHNYNQYWSQLNQAPLAAKQDWARNHADIAFAQLRHLWQKAESPESMMVLVPGSFNDSQLSLLLGMVGALPAKTVAVIDNALASCLGHDNETLFVDVQLHQAVVTLCSPEGDTLKVTDQEIFPDLGMMQIYNSVARHISNLLIESNRYDPLHSSASEQAIFDQIPDWLARLSRGKEISASLDSDHGEMRFILRNDDVRRLVSERLANISSFRVGHPQSHPVLSSCSQLLAGLSDEFIDAQVSSATAAVDYCFSQSVSILDQVDGLFRIRSLKREFTDSTVAAKKEILATHVLYRDQAMTLLKPVSIRINGQGLQLSNTFDKQAALTIVIKNQVLEAIHADPELEITLPLNCRPGEAIKVGNHQLRLIEVKGG